MGAKYKIGGYGAGDGLAVDGANLDNTLITGKAGGQTVFGGVAASETLTMRSTTHATKGTITVGETGSNGRVVITPTSVALHTSNSQDILVNQNDAVYIEGLGLRVSGGRAVFAGAAVEIKGGNVASAATMTFPTEPTANGGNFFQVTGTTAIDFITTTSWQSGARIEIYFAGALTLNNMTASPPGGTAPLKLKGNANLAVAATSTIPFRYDAANGWWIQMSEALVHA